MPKPWVNAVARREVTVHIENFKGPPDHTWCGIEDDAALFYPDEGGDTLVVQDFAIQDAARKGGSWKFVRCAKCEQALKTARAIMEARTK